MNKFLINIGDNYLVNCKYKWSEDDQITYINGYYVSSKIRDAKSFNRDQLNSFFMDDYCVGDGLKDMFHIEGYLVHPSYVGVTRHKENCDKFTAVSKCPLCYSDGIVTKWIEDGILGQSICGKCNGSGLISDHGRPYHIDNDINNKLNAYQSEDSYYVGNDIIKVIVK